MKEYTFRGLTEQDLKNALTNIYQEIYNFEKEQLYLESIRLGKTVCSITPSSNSIKKHGSMDMWQ